LLFSALQCGDCLVELNDLRLESFSGVNGKQQLLLALDASLQEQRQRCSAQEAAGSVLYVGLRMLIWRHTGVTHSTKTSRAVRQAATQWQQNTRVSSTLYNYYSSCSIQCHSLTSLRDVPAILQPKRCAIAQQRTEQPLLLMLSSNATQLCINQLALSKRLQAEYSSKEAQYLQAASTLGQPQLNYETDQICALQREVEEDRRDSKAFVDGLTR
jgi:hypothetical protein